MELEKYLTIDEVYNDLCMKIENLDLMPGESISENALCKSYGVTRHIVRGAITRAKERGLLEVYPQRKTVVSLINMGYVEDILFVRESIEQEALRRIMDLPEKDRMALVSVLKDNITKQKTYIDEEVEVESGGFYTMDQRFHTLMLNAVGKAHAMALIEDNYIHVRRWRKFETSKKVSRRSEIIGEHESIVNAIENGNKYSVWEVLHKHLDTVTRYEGQFKGIHGKYFKFREE